MDTSIRKQQRAIPSFSDGIIFFGKDSTAFGRHGQTAAVSFESPHQSAPFTDDFVYQTLIGADALRYLTMQMTATKSSGHPGGFMSSAEVVSSLMMLGYKNMVTEVGHHAPGYYAALFLDTSLERMGIKTVEDLTRRFREPDGLLGHITGAIPGVLSPAGPLGQGQHFAMAGAYLYPDTLFPLTVGDGGFGEPYVMSAFKHFGTLFSKVTNFLPILIWNGFSQEHHSIVSRDTNNEMIEFWRSHGFKRILLVDAAVFDSSGNGGVYSDSTRFNHEDRMRFTRAVIEAIADGASSALGGTHTALIVKQLKGAGAHVTGAKAHSLNPRQTLETESISQSLQRLALAPRAWELVRSNFRAAGGGPAADIAVTEREYPLEAIGELPVSDYRPGDKQVPTTAFGLLVSAAGRADVKYIVTNADGNQASGMMNINEAIGIRHPTTDELYAQRPDGRVYEPLSEDACAGIAGAVSLMGGRALWCSYESFAVNGLPIWQTVTQAMAELRRKTPSAIALFTAGALEQGRNGWTHQRPEVEGYFASMMRNGNIFPLFPVDANSIQACYEWALSTKNFGIPIFASKSALPVRVSLADARGALESGVVTLHDVTGGIVPHLVIATIGDIVLLPVMDAVKKLEAEGVSVKVVAIVSPRRLLRSDDVLWDRVAIKDGLFLDDEDFDRHFGTSAILAVTGGAAAMAEPVVLRARAVFDLVCWKRGETTASQDELFALNGMTGEEIARRAQLLLKRMGKSA